MTAPEHVQAAREGLMDLRYSASQLHTIALVTEGDEDNGDSFQVRTAIVLNLKLLCRTQSC